MSVHIGAQKGDIAEAILLPGDPLRAKWIAETFLENPKLYNEVRGMYGFTGTYKGQRVSVQGTGMGMPSASIYIHELIADYGVKKLIRIGTCGAISTDIKVRDVIIGLAASTDSHQNNLRFPGLNYAPCADYGLLSKAVEVAQQAQLPVRVGGLFSSDTFYNEDNQFDKLKDYGILGIEMEAAALYTVAAQLQAQALAICTVSDHIVTGEEIDSLARQESLKEMVTIALETAISA